jgi:hypothetical protein
MTEGSPRKDSKAEWVLVVTTPRVLKVTTCPQKITVKWRNKRLSGICIMHTTERRRTYIYPTNYYRPSIGLDSAFSRKLTPNDSKRLLDAPHNRLHDSHFNMNALFA